MAPRPDPRLVSGGGNGRAPSGGDDGERRGYGRELARLLAGVGGELMHSPGKGLSSVRRLYRILKAGTDKDGSRPALEVWAELLGVDQPAVGPAAMVALGQVFALIEEARVDAQAHPELESELFVHPLEQLASVLLRPGLNSRWTEIVNVYSPFLSKLAYCAHEFDSRSREIQLPSEALDRLRKDVDGLLQRLRDSPIAEPARSEIAVRIEDLRSAIVRYSFGGVEPIKVAAEAAFGAVLIVHQRQPPKGESWRTVVKDVLLIVQSAFTLVESGLRAAPQLAPAVSDFVKGLLSPGG